MRNIRCGPVQPPLHATRFTPQRRYDRAIACLFQVAPRERCKPRRVPRGVLFKHGVMLTRAKKTFADLDNLLQFILTNYGESWFNARN